MRKKSANLSNLTTSMIWLPRWASRLWWWPFAQSFPAPDCPGGRSFRTMSISRTSYLHIHIRSMLKLRSDGTRSCLDRLNVPVDQEVPVAVERSHNRSWGLGGWWKMRVVTFKEEKNAPHSNEHFRGAKIHKLIFNQPKLKNPTICLPTKNLWIKFRFINYIFRN